MSQTLEASVNDLALAGNYFADGLYLAAQPEDGTLRNRGGTRLVALPDELFTAVCNAMEEIVGDQASGVPAAVGKRWGQQAATLFARELRAFHGKPLAELPLSLAIAAMREAFRSHGWGILTVDPSRYASGVLVVTLQEPVLGADVRRDGKRIEYLTAGFLAGFFSNWAGMDLDCLQTSAPRIGTAASTFVLSLPDRIRALESQAAAGLSHDEVVAKLEQVRAA